MAPVQSMKKQLSAKKSLSGKGALPSTKSPGFDEDFRTSKRDKRTIKQASFLSKIEKSSQKTPKRRRASKKLSTNLEALADALPEAETELDDPANQVNIIKQKTLRHKPGAMKRKQQIEKVERDRFAKNMAQLSTVQTPESNADQENPTSNRWAALRNFVSQTMEHQPVFKDNK